MTQNIFEACGCQLENIKMYTRMVEVMTLVPCDIHNYYLSQCMRFPTMWYVRPAKPQISLRIHAV